MHLNLYRRWELLRLKRCRIVPFFLSIRLVFRVEATNGYHYTLHCVHGDDRLLKCWSRYFRLCTWTRFIRFRACIQTADPKVPEPCCTNLISICFSLTSHPTCATYNCGKLEKPEMTCPRKCKFFNLYRCWT